MEPMRWLYMQSRGVIFFPWGQRRGGGAGVWMEFCKFCVLSMFPIMFLNFPMCPPEHHTFIPHSLRQSSPFSPSPLYRGPKRRHSILTQKLLFGEIPKVRFFLIQILIKKSNNLIYRLHGTSVASTLIILFSEMLKFQNFSFERTKIWEGKY